MRRFLCVSPSVLLAGFAIVFSGCASTPPVQEPPTVVAVARPLFTQDTEEVVMLLGYYQNLLVLSAEGLRREYQSVSQAFGHEKTEQRRLKLVLLMNVPGAAWRDDAKLQSLLDSSTSRSATLESPLRQFVLIVQKLVAERQREQRRADEIQQKLDALLDIERNLSRKNSTGIKKP